MSLFGKLRLIDLYKKVPHDLTEGTYAGAILSISCTIVMVMLFFSSLSEYLSSTPTSQMLIDDSPSESKLPIVFSIQFTKVPCSMIYMDNQDLLGFSAEGVQENIIKRKMFNGLLDAQEYKGTAEPGFDSVKEELGRKEGCQVEGRISVNRVPGNIHFSLHNEKINRLYNNLTLAGIHLNYAHKILHFSFGSHDHEVISVLRKFPDLVLFPLEGSAMDEDINLAIAYQYYLNVVRAKVMVKGVPTEAYQYTISKSFGITKDMPALFFKYEISPLYVHYELKEKSIWHFIVNICAIIGGVYTAFSILDAVVYSSVTKIFKDRIGKLS